MTNSKLMNNKQGTERHNADNADPSAWFVAFTQKVDESNTFTEMYFGKSERDHWIKVREANGFKATAMEFCTSRTQSESLSAGGWVKCSEQMPPIGEPANVAHYDKLYPSIYFWNGQMWDDLGEQFDPVYPAEIAQWMPLQKPQEHE